MINVNNFPGKTDNEILENAIRNRQADGIVVIPPRVSHVDPERNYWLLDRAILLPANTTVVLQNCMIKLSDRCRDNFFRSANCGMGIEFPERIQNIHIRGEGFCTLLGADHPRAVGDGGKILACPCAYLDEDLYRLGHWIPEERRAPGKLTFWDRHDHSFGTDAGKEEESQYGDWRGVGILLANVENFSIDNLHIKDSHGWAISMEACAYGSVKNIHFDMCMSKEIDGMLHNMENQDGINLRNGCHHIIVSDITGRTGDDVVALTAIADDTYCPGGSLRTTHVMHNDWSKRERDIHDVIIRNITAYSQLCYLVRMLPCNAKIYNVVADGIIDTAPEDVNHAGGFTLGEPDTAYGVNHKDGLKNIIISNVICNCAKALHIGGYLSDSMISNVMNKKTDGALIVVEREDGLVNVQINH